MRLPQSLLESQYFLFSSLAEFQKAIAPSISKAELIRVKELAAKNLPPITSRHILATMFGINPGLIWSFEQSPLKHYRSFEIPKGKTTRRIDAPRVALKIIQKWMSVQLVRKFEPLEHVFGFVTGRSHVDAAKIHCNAKWVFSVDITNFFQTTPISLVSEELMSIGFDSEGAKLLSRLCCLRGYLAQGAPTSPILSNICFREIDDQLLKIASKYSVRLTRYADDIVFSGTEGFPKELKQEIKSLFINKPWHLSEKKTQLTMLPDRLKVHGMLVHCQTIRLTKGYRNRLRAYRYLFNKGSIQESDIAKIRGHLNYDDYVQKKSQD